jgi:hypothetical protein
MDGGINETRNTVIEGFSFFNRVWCIGNRAFSKVK